jgi:hypothetical protein
VGTWGRLTRTGSLQRCVYLIINCWNSLFSQNWIQIWQFGELIAVTKVPEWKAIRNYLCRHVKNSLHLKFANETFLMGWFPSGCPWNCTVPGKQRPPPWAAEDPRPAGSLGTCAPPRFMESFLHPCQLQPAHFLPFLCNPGPVRNATLSRLFSQPFGDSRDLGTQSSRRLRNWLLFGLSDTPSSVVVTHWIWPHKCTGIVWVNAQDSASPPSCMLSLIQ